MSPASEGGRGDARGSESAQGGLVLAQDGVEGAGKHYTCRQGDHGVGEQAQMSGRLDVRPC